MALGHRQVGIFLPMLLKATEARQVGPLLRSLQLQTSARWKLGLHWFLHTEVSTSAQTLNPMPSHRPERDMGPTPSVFPGNQEPSLCLGSFCCLQPHPFPGDPSPPLMAGNPLLGRGASVGCWDPSLPAVSKLLSHLSQSSSLPVERLLGMKWEHV